MPNIKLTYFSTFIFMVGIVLTVLTVDQHSKISNKCVSKTVQLGFNVLLMLSVMMMVIPLVQVFCHWGCGCPQTNLNYKWIIVSLAVLLIASSSVVLNGLNSDKTCETKNAKSFMTGIIIVCSSLVFMLVFLPIIVPGIQSWWGGRSKDSISSSSSVNQSSSVKFDDDDPLVRQIKNQGILL